MADPISIISLLGTGLSLTGTILKYASSVKDVPNEWKSLGDELSELHGLFEQVLEKEGSKEGTQDIADVVPLYPAARVGPILSAFSSRRIF